MVAVDVEQAALDRLTAEIAAAGGRAVGIRADALDAASVEDAVRRGRRPRPHRHPRQRGGREHHGPAPAALLDELTLEEWQRLLHFNLTGTFLFSHAVIPVMKRQKSGKIVNLSSIAGRGVSRRSSSAYATAKGGIIALTRKLSLELGPHGITVNAIAPSLTLSERIRPHWERRSAEAQAAEIGRTPLGRVATPEDQARVICFLASADADFVTGVTIDVTGGSSARSRSPVTRQGDAGEGDFRRGRYTEARGVSGGQAIREVRDVLGFDLAVVGGVGSRGASSERRGPRGAGPPSGSPPRSSMPAASAPPPCPPGRAPPMSLPAPVPDTKTRSAARVAREKAPGAGASGGFEELDHGCHLRRGRQKCQGARGELALWWIIGSHGDRSGI